MTEETVYGTPKPASRRGGFRRRLRLLRYARRRKAALGTVLTSMLLATGLGVLAPWPTKVLIDNVIGDAPLDGVPGAVFGVLPGGLDVNTLIVWVALATLLVFLLGNAIEMVNGIASIKLAQRMTYDLAADVFMHLQRLSLRFHARRPVGDTIARTTSDTFALQTAISGVLLPMFQSVVTLASMFAIMLALSPAMTLLALAVVPFQLITIVVFGKPMHSRSRHRLDLEGRMVSVVEHTLTSMPVVQAFTREDREHREFRGFADRTLSAYVRETLAGQWFKLAAGAVTAVGTAGVMYLGARYAVDGKVTAGTIIVFLTYLGALYGPLDNIAYTASTYQVAAAQADRVLEILDEELDVQEKPGAPPLPPVQGHVRYEGVSFSYEPDRRVLDGVSLEAHAGEVVAIVGPTGAGKTTIVNMLLRFFDPDEGRVTIDGHDLRDVQIRSLREQVAIVMQDPFILPLTVAQNIAYGRPSATSEEVEAAARAANAHDFVMRLPDGYDSVIGERGATLSGGEKQRLSIARAFLKDAPILILDEPTSALDARTEGALLDALARLSEGRTSFVIAHRLSTIRNADRILVVDDGRIIEQGSHAELSAADGLYASLYRQQMDIARHADAGGTGPAAVTATVAATSAGTNGDAEERSAAKGDLRRYLRSRYRRFISS